jgi:hypothetical protein
MVPLHTHIVLTSLWQHPTDLSSNEHKQNKKIFSVCVEIRTRISKADTLANSATLPLWN